MGFRDWWHRNHHVPSHHSKRFDTSVSRDGHAATVETSHCDKRNHRDAHEGYAPGPDLPWHGTRLDGVSEFHPHPPAVAGPVVMPVPCRPEPVPVVTRVTEVTVERSCPTSVVRVGPWRPVNDHCHDSGPDIEPIPVRPGARPY